MGFVLAEPAIGVALAEFLVVGSDDEATICTADVALTGGGVLAFFASDDFGAGFPCEDVGGEDGGSEQKQTEYQVKI